MIESGRIPNDVPCLNICMYRRHSCADPRPFLVHNEQRLRDFWSGWREWLVLKREGDLGHSRAVGFLLILFPNINRMSLLSRKIPQVVI